MSLMQCNKKSSLIYFPDRYFEDEEVLSRVPSLFLFLGGIFAIMQFIAFILLRPPSKGELKEIMVLLQNQLLKRQ